jgi:hypothetical protein
VTLMIRSRGWPDACHAIERLAVLQSNRKATGMCGSRARSRAEKER